MDRESVFAHGLGLHVAIVLTRWYRCSLASARFELRTSRFAAGNRQGYFPWLPHNHPDERKGIHVANIKSQIKRILTNKKSQDRNKAVKSEVKTAVRATREAIAAGDKTKAAAALAVAAKKLDKAASKGVIHRNQAANRKSSIAKQVSAL
jgi:small subunit ribosomal protein S20